MPVPVGFERCAQALLAGADTVVVVHADRFDGWRHYNRWSLTRGIAALFCLSDVDPIRFDWSIVRGRTVLLLSWSGAARGALSAALINAEPAELTRVALDGDLAFPQLWDKGVGQWQTFMGPEATELRQLKTIQNTSEPCSTS